MNQPLLENALAQVRRQWPHRTPLAVILGTGLGSLAEEVRDAVRFPYTQLPGFPRATALSHKGELVCGQLAGCFVVLMNGRFHGYEGYSRQEITWPLRVLRGMGATCLIVSNAAGGLNPHFAAGDLVLLEDHIDWMFTLDDPADSPASWPRCCPPSPCYDRQLRQWAIQVARREDFVLQRGVYLGVRGPNYETRAEIRAMRRIGADVVGMSTIPEVVSARRLQMRVLGISTVTNVARPDVPRVITAEEVVDVARQAASRLRRIILDIARRMACDSG